MEDFKMIDYRRGFLRLWIIVSALWVACTALYLEPAKQLASVGAQITLHDGQQEIQFPNNTSIANMKRGIVNYLKEMESKIPSPPAGFVIDPIDYDARSLQIMGGYQPTTTWSVLANIFFDLFTLPIILFVLGFSVFWIASGFRRVHVQP
jgi:hypothetical protein